MNRLLELVEAAEGGDYLAFVALVKLGFELHGDPKAGLAAARLLAEAREGLAGYVDGAVGAPAPHIRPTCKYCYEYDGFHNKTCSILKDTKWLQRIDAHVGEGGEELNRPKPKPSRQPRS